MKRSYLKRGNKPLKRSSFKRKSPSGTILPKTGQVGLKSQNIKRKRKKKTPRQIAEDKIWELCKKITKLRHGNTCYTSGQTNLEGVNAQCGHGKPKGALSLIYKYDLRNLRPQSFNANINLGGMTDVFIAKLEREKEGLQFLEEACVKIDGRWEIKHIEPMGSAQALLFLQNTIAEYEKILGYLQA